MTRCLPACLIAIALAAVGVSAQYPEQKPSEKQMPSKSGQTVTITGCVREGDTPNTFLLANVDPKALSAQPGAGATGTAGTPPPAGAAATAAAMTSVLLISTADIDLTKHVGHKVEVSGVIAPAKPEAGTAGTPTTDTTAREAEKDKSKAPAHKLTVRSVKHISETCSM
jgi:hypothetical protein